MSGRTIIRDCGNGRSETDEPLGEPWVMGGDWFIVVSGSMSYGPFSNYAVASEWARDMALDGYRLKRLDKPMLTVPSGCECPERERHRHLPGCRG